MKIGFSLSLCVNDIMNGKVDIDEVLVIITRTKINSADEMYRIMKSYYFDSRIDRENPDFRSQTQEERRQFSEETITLAANIAAQLYEQGKLHQPRLYGVTPETVFNQDETWMDLAPTVQSKNENVVSAWKNYQMLLKLTGDKKLVVPEHIRKEDK
jgi:hypothetical protein